MGIQPAFAMQIPGSSSVPAMLQQAAPQSSQSVSNPPANSASSLPEAPAPKLTEPLYLRSTPTDYTHGKGNFFRNPFLRYAALDYFQPRLTNSTRLDGLLRDGKIYLSLSDAITLALENNYDIAIARINLDIADTDILRTHAGATFRGVSTGIVAGTLGGQTSTITGGGGPGGTSSASGGAGTGANGIVLSTNGGGPTPENLDPTLTGTVQYESAATVQAVPLLSGLPAGQNTLKNNTSTYNAAYNQGFLTGTNLQVAFNNTRQTTNGGFSSYSPILQSNFRATATQHLLQGFGPGINGRFIVQAKNNRRITDSAFRQQVLYTVNQVENIYWGLVSAYENEQAKDRALAQSTQLSIDNRKQLEIGTLAPLDIVNSDASVATDKQALIAAKTNLEYQQLIMKQAIARNLNDPELSSAPVIPTDRVSLDRLPEEDMQVDDLVHEAYANNPQIEQAVLNMKNNELTIKAEKNGLLPVVDAYAFYGASAIGGSQNKSLNCGGFANLNNPIPCPPGTVPTIGYNDVFGHLFNSSSPDKGVGVSISIPLRNRTAQADQARSQMEYRQSQMRLQQLYTQIRIQVINGQYALTNDRAQVVAAQASRTYAAQSVDAEQKKYRLGASTTANVLQMTRNLASSENTLISATAAYAKDRAALRQLLSDTLQVYGINLVSSATGIIEQPPVVPGLTAPQAPETPQPIGNPAPLQ
jgi:outer membrane protein TolC